MKTERTLVQAGIILMVLVCGITAYRFHKLHGIDLEVQEYSIARYFRVLDTFHNTMLIEYYDHDEQHTTIWLSPKRLMQVGEVDYLFVAKYDGEPALRVFDKDSAMLAGIACGIGLAGLVVANTILIKKYRTKRLDPDTCGQITARVTYVKWTHGREPRVTLAAKGEIKQKEYTFKGTGRSVHTTIRCGQNVQVLIDEDHPHLYAIDFDSVE
jgi:hypothetical protein